MHYIIQTIDSRSIDIIAQSTEKIITAFIGRHRDEEAVNEDGSRRWNRD